MIGDVDNQGGNNGHHNGNGHPDGKMLGGITGKGFMPGQSGNPGGRPKGRSIVARLRELIDESDESSECLARAIAKTGLDMAKAGDFRFWKEVLDRIDGKPPETVQSEGKLEVVVRYVDMPVRVNNHADD